MNKAVVALSLKSVNLRELQRYKYSYVCTSYLHVNAVKCCYKSNKASFKVSTAHYTHAERNPFKYNGRCADTNLASSYTYSQRS